MGFSSTLEILVSTIIASKLEKQRSSKVDYELMTHEPNIKYKCLFYSASLYVCV